MDVKILRARYCPPLDEALFNAIASDYTIPQDKAALVAVLDDLAVSAIEQESTDFDPSGTGAPAVLQDATDTSRSNPEDNLSSGVASITTGVSELRSSDTESLGHGLQNASVEQKTAWLKNMFPDVPKVALVDVLASHDGSLDRATDELLNLSFLNQEYYGESEDVPVLKGVDGFAEGLLPTRKGRKRRKPRTNESSRTSSASSPPDDSEPAPANIWSTMSEDVDFICSRTKLTPQVVRSEYHLNGARLPATIRALASKEGANHDKTPQIDPVLVLQISEFKHEFEHVPDAQLFGMLVLARNIPSAAQ
jgi:hypothetical protein